MFEEVVKNEIKLEKYDLVKEIKTIIDRYGIFNETEGYEIVYEGIDEAFVKADREQLNQVIYNLINNAINYTENKKVIVKVEELKKEYEISFIDFGKGIKKEEIELIWDRYYKSEKKYRRNIIGTGLGLSIVKNIFETHKLDYGVKSKEKEGSTFYFKIKKVVNKK
jgi:signal transduction histidine kinase